MFLKPANNRLIPGRSAVEIWDGMRHVATVYAQQTCLQIVCESGAGIGEITVQTHEPQSAQIEISDERTAR